jgi:hypothetical protein
MIDAPKPWRRRCGDHHRRRRLAALDADRFANRQVDHKQAMTITDTARFWES